MVRRNFATSFLNRKRKEQGQKPTTEDMGIAPSPYQRYGVNGMGKSQLSSGHYTGDGPNGISEPHLPTERRMTMNGRPYVVDESEVLVNDAGTVRDYGGAQSMDRFIQENRDPRMRGGGVPSNRYTGGGVPTQSYAGGGMPQGQPQGMMPQGGQGVFDGNPMRPYDQQADIMQELGVGDLPRMAEGGVPEYQTKEYGAPTPAPEYQTKEYGAPTPAPEYQTKEYGAPAQPTEVVAPLGERQYGPSTPSGAPVMPGPIPAGASGIPLAQAGTPTLSPSQLDEMVLDRYLTRQAGASESERAGEAQRLLQQGVGDEAMRGMQAVSDVSRRSALGDTTSQFAINAAQRQEARDTENRALSENKRRWDLNWGAEESTRMLYDAAVMSEEQWLKKHPGATADDYTKATRMGDVAYEAAAHTLMIMREDDFGSNVFDYYLTRPDAIWREDHMAENALRTFYESTGGEASNGDFATWADQQESAATDPRVTSIIGGYKRELDRLVESGILDEDKASDMFEFFVAAQSGELTVERQDLWNVGGQTFDLEEDANAYAIENDIALNQIEKVSVWKAIDQTTGTVFKADGGGKGTETPVSDREALKEEIKKANGVFDVQVYKNSKALLGREPSYDEYTMLNSVTSNVASAFVKQDWSSLEMSDYGDLKSLWNNLGEDYQEENPLSKIVGSIDQQRGEALEVITSGNYTDESSVLGGDFSVWTSGNNNDPSKRWVMTNEADAAVSKMVGKWVSVNGKLYKVTGYNNNWGDASINSTPSVSMYDPVSGDNFRITNMGEHEGEHNPFQFIDTVQNRQDAGVNPGNAGKPEYVFLDAKLKG